LYFFACPVNYRRDGEAGDRHRDHTLRLGRDIRLGPPALAERTGAEGAGSRGRDGCARDPGYADYFFPGTSVLQTRPRYLFFACWNFLWLARQRGVTAANFLKRKDEAELWVTSQLRGPRVTGHRHARSVLPFVQSPVDSRRDQVGEGDDEKDYDAFGVTGYMPFAPLFAGAASPLANSDSMIATGTLRRCMIFLSGLMNAGSRTDSGAMLL
jgi:hypothetical protein